MGSTVWRERAYRRLILELPLPSAEYTFYLSFLLGLETDSVSPPRCILWNLTNVMVLGGGAGGRQ